jgi:hypothetical protein
MRFGRIILAVLAPLVSLSAVKTDLAAAGNTASADSLTSLLRAVAPMVAVYAAETQQVARAHTGQVESPVLEVFTSTHGGPIRNHSPDDTLRLLTRQQLRAQLRC